MSGSTILYEYSPLQRTEMSTSKPMLLSTTRKGTGEAVPYLLPMISFVLKKYTRWSLPVSPPNVKRVPTRSNDAMSLSPRLASPKNRLGSVDLSKTNSPASPHASTIAPCSTIIMNWPSLTAMIEPSEMMLLSPRVFELRPLSLVRFWPFATNVLASSASQ